MSNSCKTGVQFYSSECEYPIFPATFVEETVFSPFQYILSSFINYFIISAWGLFRAFDSIPLVCMPIMSILCPLDYNGFIIQLNISKCDAFSFVLLLQYFFGYLMSFMVPNEYQNCAFYFYKNSIVILMCSTLKLQMVLGSMEILTILILPIYEHRILFYLFVFSLVTFIFVSQLSVTNLIPLWLNLFLSLFFLFLMLF